MLWIPCTVKTGLSAPLEISPFSFLALSRLPGPVAALLQHDFNIIISSSEQVFLLNTCPLVQPTLLEVKTGKNVFEIGKNGQEVNRDETKLV